MNVCKLVIGSMSLAACLALVSGCTEQAAQQEAEERDHLKTLALMYGKYLGSYGGVGPTNEKQFKDFLNSRKQELAQMQIEDIDALFISPRDGQPYTVVYGLRPGPSPGPSGRVIAYESQGVDGKRMVAYELTFIEEMDEAKFQTVVPKK